VTVSADDFNNLQTMAKKQIATTKSTKKLKSQVAELTQENRELTAKVEDLKAKSGKSIKLQIENDNLKKKIGVLQNSLDWVMKFIEKFDLSERLESFLNQFRERGQESKNKGFLEL
jgi:regulator of replication initiation timing